MRFTVLGDGAMGTTCAMHLARRTDFDVTLWCQFEENAQAILRDGENKKFLPGVVVDKSVTVTSDPERALQADAFLLAVPMLYLSKTLERLAPLWPNASEPIPVASVIKGIEQGTFRRPSEIIESMLPGSNVIAFTGPMHAEEIARGMPASIVAASSNAALAEQLQQWTSTDRLRVYTSPDLIGAELGGALKNVIAIAAGICDGAGFGDNAKSALMTRGLVEMVRFGVALGAKTETFYGLAGVGDLITTCVSPHGRNRKVGERIGRGETFDDIINSMQQVAEGVWTTRGAHEMAIQRGISMPVTEQVYRVLFEKKDFTQAVDDLMNRPLIDE